LLTELTVTIFNIIFKTVFFIHFRFVLSHPLVASAVIGATSVDQLRAQLGAAEAGPLGEELMMKIDEVHKMLPNPAP
jgi:aryl-alcohol dehydrogenase-like predicted oxidoreductase